MQGHWVNMIRCGVSNENKIWLHNKEAVNVFSFNITYTYITLSLYPFLFSCVSDCASLWYRVVGLFFSLYFSKQERIRFASWNKRRHDRFSGNIVTRLQAGQLEFCPQQRQWKDFFFAMVSRWALGPTQPHIQWVLGARSQEVKQLGHEADHSPPSSAMFQNVWGYAST